MDTASHLLFGATLAGLAMTVPAVAADANLANAVLAATLIGSHAPDFDTLSRVRGFSVYLRIHRGLTHSLPALLAWPLAIGLPIAWLFGCVDDVGHVLVWSFVAVFLHVFLDWFNAYGVQCFRPFSSKWHHLDVLSLFEPFLFAIHAVGLLLWTAFHMDPGRVFPVVYALTGAYIAARAVHRNLALRMVRRLLDVSGDYHVIPTLRPLCWQFVAESSDRYYTGQLEGRRLTLLQEHSKEADNPIIAATRATDGVRALLRFAQTIHVSCSELQDGYEVRWSDVRFHHKRKLAFGVDLRLDRELNVVEQRMGYRKRGFEPPYL